MHSFIRWIDLHRLLVFSNSLLDFVEFGKGVTFSDSEPKLHIGHSLLVICGVLSVLPVLIVLNQSESIITLSHNTSVLFKRQKASNFVHVNGYVVQSGRVSRDS